MSNKLEGSAPCPHPDCDARVRGVFNPHTQEYRYYHGEECLVACPVGHLSEEVQAQAAEALVSAMGAVFAQALIELHASERSQVA